ncbi:MAG: tetratricopeptide repeat protein [Nitrospirae bacterium]|nr:tetratricopeptide repeat protein [Nitrospirota bacterium]
MLTLEAAKRALKQGEHDRWMWAVPVLLALFVNLNVLANGFGLDDEQIIPNLRLPGQSWNQFLADQIVAPSLKESAVYFRPVVSLSYLLDYALWGYNPFGYHLSIWIAHILNTALVFFLTRGLMRNIGPPRGAVPTDAARLASHAFLPLIASSLFAVHPIHAEAVAWIAGRNDVFCAFFMLLSMVLYIRFRRTGGWLSFGSSMAAFLLALLTKEMAVGLILLFVIYDSLSRSNSGSRWNALGWPTLLLILGVYFWMRTTNITHPAGGISSASGLFSFEAVLGMIATFGFYLKLILFPYPHQPFIDALTFSPLFLKFAVLTFVLLLSVAIWTFIRRAVLLSIGLCWFSILIAPAVLVAVMGLALTPVAERYVYAPSVGVFIVGAWLMMQVPGRLAVVMGRHRVKVWMTASLIVIAIVAFLGKESWSRNAVWRSPVTFWEAALAGSPAAGVPHLGLGAHYALRGRDAEAEHLYQQAVSIGQNGGSEGRNIQASGFLYLAELYSGQGKQTEAETLYLDAIKIWQSNPESNPHNMAIALHNLALHYSTQKRYGEAEPLYHAAIAIMEKSLGPGNPEVATGLRNLAVLYRNQGRYTEAEMFFQRSLEIRKKALGSDHPAIASSLLDLADLYRDQARFTEAEPLYQQSLDIWEKALGREHLFVAESLGSYADLLRKMKRDAEAEKIEARAKAIREKQVRKD